jgi:RNA polymerase sigma-70 factor, ECF subfamily
MKRPTEDQIAQWYPRLYRTALRMTGNADDAADLTQQAFYRALGAWDQFQGPALPTTWLHQILLNCVRDWARRRAVRPATRIDPWDLAALAPEAAAEHAAIENREQLGFLRQAIDALAPPIRQALIVTVIEGFSYQEAAEQLNVPTGTIASRVHEARVQLRTVLKGSLGEA